MLINKGANVNYQQKVSIVCIIILLTKQGFPHRMDGRLFTLLLTVATLKWSSSFAISGHQQKSFTITLAGDTELQGGLPMGKLSIGVKETSEENYHTLILIKVSR